MSKVSLQGEGHEALGRAGVPGSADAPARVPAETPARVPADVPAHARVVYKPLVRKCQASNKEGGEGKRPVPASNDPFRRAANEDDDGYDPYSDRPADPVPLFESDPWS